MLQEVHCSEKSNPMWSPEWGYRSILSGLDSNQSRVAVLFNNTFDFKIKKSFLDPNGRYIICDIETDNKYITLATLYAPNDDDSSFFETFFVHLLDFECDDIILGIILGGDFNPVLDVTADKKGGNHKTHSKYLEIIRQFVTELDLLDAWRVLNPDSRLFTWRRKKPEISCRLDFLISQSLMCNVTSVSISVGYKTDHSLIDIKIALHSNPRGPGFWKLNTSFLNENDYIGQIQVVIKETHEEYRHDKTMNDALLWEIIKLKIREHSIKYATTKRAKTVRREEELEKEINILQHLIDTQNENNEIDIADTFHNLEIKKRELEEIVEYRTKGSILRARCRLSLTLTHQILLKFRKKRHHKQGTISQLKQVDESFVTTDKEILYQCETFYRELYRSKIGTCDDKYDFFLKNQHIRN